MAQPDAPALLVEPTAETRRELFEVVASALSRRDITLSPDALIRSSLLVIERRPARDPTGQRLSGRDYDEPEQFQLVTSDGRCALVHQRTAKRYELHTARCVAE